MSIVMTRHRSIRASTAGAPTSARSGITLLEVLVACGILVVGLASLASVLPAASSRLAQATIEDRGGIAAANAYAEVVNRTLTSGTLFQANGTGKACGFGRMMDVAAALTDGGFKVSNHLDVANPTELAKRVDPTRGWVLEDDLVYGAMTGTAETPPNRFFNTSAGPREYREGICWGATLSPLSGTATAGGQAVLGVAIFRKTGSAELLKLVGSAGSSLFEHSSTKNGKSRTALDDEDTRKRMLQGCSYVLALPASSASAPNWLRPRWLRITSSWTTPGPGTPEDVTKRQSFVVLDIDSLGADAAGYIDGTGAAGMYVVAFENLLRADTYTVTLD